MITGVSEIFLGNIGALGLLSVDCGFLVAFSLPGEFLLGEFLPGEFLLGEFLLGVVLGECFTGVFLLE